MATSRIPTLIVPSPSPSSMAPAAVAREFRALLDNGAVLRPRGSARRRPRVLLERGYGPKFKIELFDSTFYLSGLLQNPELRFFVAYHVGADGERVHPNIFYKDVSLVWRSASHYFSAPGELWIGKGDVRTFTVDGEEMVESVEATTDLPLELQGALEEVCRRGRRVRRDEAAVDLVLRRAARDRIEPYRDFTEPRRRAFANAANRINGGRRVARFRRKGDPSSLVFVRGYEPDFADGVFETDTLASRLYGGKLKRYRILSTNRRIQYLFFAGPRHVWIAPPQATTTELSIYGLRTIDALIDDDLCVPGYEFHFMDDATDPPELFSQIPDGFAGATHPNDPDRADASPWIEKMPVIAEFRRRVLGSRTRRARKN